MHTEKFSVSGHARHPQGGFKKHAAPRYNRRRICPDSSAVQSPVPSPCGCQTPLDSKLDGHPIQGRASWTWDTNWLMPWLRRFPSWCHMSTPPKTNPPTPSNRQCQAYREILCIRSCQTYREILCIRGCGNAYREILCIRSCQTSTRGLQKTCSTSV
jgi:hypothetical protein